MAGGLRRNRYDLAVVGAGVTGLTAAWHAGLRGLSVLVSEGAALSGGQIATVRQIEGLPGRRISGPDLASSLLDETARAGGDFLPLPVDAIERGHGGFVLRHDGGFALARSVLLATGGSARPLGLPGERELEGRGVSHCASCDGTLCRDREVVVVGGGDAALQEALLLSDLARKVSVVLRGSPRARRSYLERAERRPNLHFIWDSEVRELRGAPTLESVVLRHRDGRMTELECFALFPKIGNRPNGGIAGGLVARDPSGHILTDGALRTATDSLFAAGAVRRGFGGDLVDAMAEGAAVARAVRERAS